MSIVSSASSAPAVSASVTAGPAGEGEDAAPVVGVGVAVEQGGAAGEGALQRVEQPLRRGPPRRWGRREGAASPAAQTSSSPPLTIVSPSISTVGSSDDAVEVDRDLDGAADRRRGAEGDVAGAEDLLVLEDVAGQDRLFVGADPELGDVGAVLAVRGQQLHQPAAVVAGRVDEVALADGQRDRRVEQADAGDRAVDDQGALGRALDRSDEALAAGQVAEGASVAEFAGVDDPQPALQPDPQVAAVGAGDPRLGAAVERGDDGPAAAPDLVEVAGHQPRPASPR